MNSRFEILEHTADVGLKARGSTLEELFANAALGMVSLALQSPEARPAESVNLAATGSDRQELLYNWLSEVLYRMDAEGWIFSRFDVTLEGPDAIRATAWGEREDPAQRARAVAVKAVTYHQMAVEQKAGGWEAVIYFDI